MARAIRSSNLETRTGRLKLPVRRKPFFVTISRGVALGYRRCRGAGSWTVRAAGWTKGFAVADDHEDADGKRVLTFWQAIDQARTLAQTTEGVDDHRPVTVSEALDAYADDLQSRDGYLSNVGRVRRHLPKFAQKAVATLRAGELRAWRDGLVKQGMARASANRTARALAAALSLAARDDPRIANTAAWRTGLRALPGAERSRNTVLPAETVRQLIDASFEYGKEFGAFVEVAASTGARTSQILRLEVRDLVNSADGPALLIPSSNKGKRHSNERKSIPITDALAALLRGIAGDRPDGAPLLALAVRPGRTFALVAARLGLADTTLYALRHTHITRLLLEGLPIRVVADSVDSSVGQIEATYSRHITVHSAALLRRALIQPATPAGNNIVPLRP